MVDSLPDLAKGRLHAIGELHLPDQKMGCSPERIMRRAKEGSLSSVWECVALQERFVSELQTLPSSFFPEALDMFAMHIESGCPPDRVEKLKFQLADASFTGLMLALNNPWFVRRSDPPLGPLLQAWTSILTWARARIIEDLRREDRARFGMSRGSNFMVACMFLNGVYNFRRNEELQLAAKDPRLLELAMHAFLHSDPQETPLKHICINLFRLCIDGRIKHALDEIVSAVQGKPEVFLSSILEFVDSASYDNDLYLGALRKCARLLLDVSTEPGHALAVTLKKNGSPFVLKALNRLRDLPLAEKTSEEFWEALTGTMALLTAHADFSTWTLQALQCRTVEMFSPCDALQLPIIRFISSSLPRHLTNSSVIYACENAVSALSTEQHKQLLAGTLAPAWKSFINHFFEKYLFYCYFEIAAYHKGCYRCGKTAGNGRMSDLKRCIACKKVEYCSKDCQTTDWKDHKKDCKTLKGKNHGPLPRWAIPLFARQLAAYDVRRHLPGIKKLAAERKHVLPLQCLYVALIYTKYPPQLDFYSEEGMDMVSVLTDEHESSDEYCFDGIRLHNGSSGVLHTVAFENEDVTTRRHEFYWSPPYFASEHGSHCQDKNERTSFARPYVDKDKRELETTWSLVDEIAYRAGLSPEMILEGRIGEIRRKVLEVVVREKARMQLIEPQWSTKT